ncbi:hypothetical protein CEP54_008323 [Fusarium duplospermum]|uniref:Uncharacterized protein n=1 Tax=Fusarium duplospermum TaxID=1325734 RepID=A0A428PWM9_9HYPO|nr:hypothetical protein CEP54_008323 [Fusarium duplospermum]
MSDTKSVSRNSTPKPKNAAKPIQVAVVHSVQALVRVVPQQPRLNPLGQFNGDVPFGIPPPNRPGASRAPFPYEPISKATIEWLGFTPAAAAKMWHAWIRWPSGLIRREIDPDDGRLCVTFLWFIQRHALYTIHELHQDIGDWWGCMEDYGLCKGAQEYIFGSASMYSHMHHGQCSLWTASLIDFHYKELQAFHLRARFNCAQRLFQTPQATVTPNRAVRPSVARRLLEGRGGRAQ